MSLVGPRPLVESEDACSRAMTGIGRGYARHDRAMAATGPMKAKLSELVELDNMYASNWRSGPTSTSC